jgi:hypothetical protein
LPPDEVSVSRNRRPVEVVAMYICGWEQIAGELVRDNEKRVINATHVRTN